MSNPSPNSEPHAIRFHETGGPEVLKWESFDPGQPGPGQIRIRTTAVGLNYIDTYHRSGLYKVPLPSGLGMEGAGVVTALGEGVTDLGVGQRIAYPASPLGAYAEERLVPAKSVVPLPDDISDQVAAAVMMKGCTAQFLLHHVFPVKKGQTILWHAAAGGVGLIATQWAKHLGVNVIGTAGSIDKVKLALAHGCAHVIDYSKENFVEQVREITGGKGVAAVFDSVGKATFPASLDCLAPLGTMISFGNASGPITSLEPAMLMTKGSLNFTRPSIMTFAGMPGWLASASAALFDVIRIGAVKVEIHQTYPLREAARAHVDLEARKTTGSSVLLP